MAPIRAPTIGAAALRAPQQYAGGQERQPGQEIAKFDAKQGPEIGGQRIERPDHGRHDAEHCCRADQRQFQAPSHRTLVHCLPGTDHQPDHVRVSRAQRDARGQKAGELVAGTAPVEPQCGGRCTKVHCQRKRTAGPVVQKRVTKRMEEIQQESGQHHRGSALHDLDRDHDFRRVKVHCRMTRMLSGIRAYTAMRRESPVKGHPHRARTEEDGLAEGCSVQLVSPRRRNSSRSQKVVPSAR